MDLCSAAPESQDAVKRRFLLNVIVRQGPSILQLLPCKDQALLFGRNALFVLDFCLDILDGIARLDFQRDRFSSQRLHEYLHIFLIADNF